MDAVEYLNQTKRICDDFNQCSNCPLYYKSRSSGCMAGLGIYSLHDFDISALVEKVEKWAKEHPKKTRQSEFLKMFPNAVIPPDGVLDISPCMVDETLSGKRCVKTTCDECRRKYWTEEIE